MPYTWEGARVFAARVARKEASKKLFSVDQIVHFSLLEAEGEKEGH